MRELTRFLSEKDLLLLVDILMPGNRNRERMVRTLREDEDILRAMIADEKVFKYLMENQESFLKVSPLLFFTVLLMKVKGELKQRSYTIEQESRRRMVVFDSGNVVDLLEDEDILPYLAGMLVSFVKINSFSIMTRVRRGVWRRLRFSDFDIESLIQYSQLIDEDQRFHPYRRIADICLFIMGIFPDFLEARELYGERKAPVVNQLTREGFVSRGRYYYRAAALHRAAQLEDLHRVLLRLSEEFALAVKPLTYLSKHYLGFLKEKLFLHF